MVFEKRIVIDCRGHLLGRLASVIAKELLQGQKIVAVRCEEINLSGSHFRNKIKFRSFLRKRMNTNPKKGPFHHRCPSRMLWRTVRGMLPHKLPRGTAALARFRCFEGVPPPYDKVKRVVVPSALRAQKLRAYPYYTTLGKLAAEVGWKYGGVVQKLEDKRRIRAQAYYQEKKARKKLELAAREKAAAQLAPHLEVLEKHGYDV